MENDKAAFGENARIENKYRILKNIGLLLMGLFVLAGIAGLTGEGPLARCRISSPDGSLIVEYDRFSRQSAPTTMRFTIVNTHPRSFARGLVLSQEFLEYFTIEYVNPEPSATGFTKENEAIYFFAAARGMGRLPVTFHLRPRKMGNLAVTVSAEQGDMLTLRQFVYF